MIWLLPIVSMVSSAIWAVVCMRAWPGKRLRVHPGVALGVALLGVWMVIGVLATLTVRIPLAHGWLGDVLLVWLAAMLTGVLTVFVVDTVAWAFARRVPSPRRVRIADLYPDPERL